MQKMSSLASILTKLLAFKYTKLRKFPQSVHAKRSVHKHAQACTMKYELQILHTILILCVLKMVFRESCSPDTPSLNSKGGALSAPPWENQPLPKPGIERVNLTTHPVGKLFLSRNTPY